MSIPDTKIAILDAAERLFAARGFDATSLRDINSAAGVNLAAVNYHFGSKDGLIQKVLERRIIPLNQERLRLLEACQPRRTPPPLNRILEALIAPAVRLSRDSDHGGAEFMRLFGRIFMEPHPGVQAMLEGTCGDTFRRFAHSFKLALPKLPEAELRWRMHFAMGAIAHTLCNNARWRFICGDLCDSDDCEEIIRHLVVFIGAGMRATAATTPPRGRVES
jgi:AcrR family transcriptional regulator